MKSPNNSFLNNRNTSLAVFQLLTLLTVLFLEQNEWINKNVIYDRNMTISVL